LLTKWKKISEEIVNRNNHWIYKLDKFEIPNRLNGEYHYVHTNGSTLIIPILPNNKILLVNQYRYLINREALEFPCGVLEDSLSPIENAQKELQEETGFKAKQIFPAGEFIPYSGVSDETCYVFIASGLYSSPLKPDETEEFELVELSVEDLGNKISTNKIKDGMTLAAWILAKDNVIEMLK
jgi:ADP-ribose pyrophosphatase